MRSQRIKSLIQWVFMAVVGLTILISCSVNNPKNDIEKVCEFELYPPNNIEIATHTSWTKEHYPVRIEEFKQDSIYPNSIVMLGNSLTEQGGDWVERLGIERVNNRGISGDNTDGVMARLGEVLCAEPTAVFVMVGTNDLWTSYTENEVASNINEIGTYLAENLENSKIFIQSIMPISEGNNQNNRLRGINTSLKSYDQSKYIFIDTWEHMSDENGYLAGNSTTDGVHLTEEGYNKWVEFLKESLR